MTTPQELLVQFDAWAKECDDKEYTDTGDAWSFLNELADALRKAIAPEVIKTQEIKNLDDHLLLAVNLYQVTNERITRISLALLAQRVWEQAPGVSKVSLEWSDQGDYLTPVGLNVNDIEEEEDILESIWDVSSNLSQNTMHIWNPMCAWDKHYFVLDLVQASQALVGA